MSESIREFFDRHAASWDNKVPPDIAQRLKRVVAAADLCAGSQVLDVGSGTGVLIPHLLGAIGPTGTLLALDISGEMLAIAKSKPFACRVHFVHADVHQIPLRTEQFDAVFCNAALPHFEDKPKALQEMVRVLRHRGVLIISHPVGREAVNRAHQAAGGAVHHNRVPPPERLHAWLEHAGLVEVKVLDEPEFYLASGRKVCR